MEIATYKECGERVRPRYESRSSPFPCIERAGLRLKAKKCKLLQEETVYLGHVISRDGVSCDPKKLSVVKEWPVPTNVKETRAFLGFVSYYRRFVPDFSTIAAPLNDLTKKNTIFHWSDACQTAFDSLRTLMTTAPVLSYPLTNTTFILDTDASLTGMGAVLSQVQDGVERLISYASKSFSRAQKQYCTTKRE
uniref:Reverse transcriptase/retrotransposon-derived protein RNase H-like domain-containing protein n=1 Tax=Ciona intestinalis TaxID=7719 RepID=F7A1A8_CIOIN